MRPAVAAVLFACLLVTLAATSTPRVAAFSILNGLLLATALFVAASRLHWTWCAIVFAGPILWWLDKPHAEPFAAEALASLAWWNMSVREVGDADAIFQSWRHIGHMVTWQASNRLFALAIDVRQGAELVAGVTQEMSVAFTAESGPIAGLRVHLRPGLGKQVIALPSPQPWVMLVAEAR